VVITKLNQAATLRMEVDGIEQRKKERHEREDMERSEQFWEYAQDWCKWRRKLNWLLRFNCKLAIKIVCV